MLLAAGANAESPNADGETALMLAARTGSVDVASKLIAAGADVNAREAWRDQTALMWAAEGAFPELVELADRARRRRARARRRERLGLADHERAARAVPPDGRPHAAAVCRALGLLRVRALDPRRRRGRRPADARRRHGADARDRQLRVRHREGAARRGREPAPLGLVGPHGALSRRRHEHLRAARRRRAGALEEHDGHGPRATRCSPPASR